MPIIAPTHITITLTLFFLVLAVSLAFTVAWNAVQHNQEIDRRLAGGSTFDIDSPNAAQPGILETLGTHLTLPDDDEISRIRHALAQAGYYHPASIKIYYAVRLLCIVGPQILMMLSWGALLAQMGMKSIIGLSLILAAAGFYGPQYFLRWKQNRRTLQSKEGFPDMMDLMVACIEAGLGLDAALIRVGQELGGRYPALKVNLDLMNLELRAGRDRHKAMMRFAERINLEEAKALAVILKQSEDMGTGIGSAMRVFSEDMRAKRMLLAEEKAMALSAKLTVPLIMFIFPTLLVILLLPAGVRISQGLL